MKVEVAKNIKQSMNPAKLQKPDGYTGPGRRATPPSMVKGRGTR